MRTYLFLVGYVRLLLPTEDLLSLFEACRQLEITPKRGRHSKKSGAYTCFFTRQEWRRLQGAAPSSATVREGGVPTALLSLSRRTGLLAGIFLGLCLFFASFFFVWDVDVVGNTEIDEAELRSELSAAGLFVGGFLPRLSTDEIEAALLLGDSRIAYAAVNVRGTVATVEIREAVKPPDPPKTAPANLVAKCDGVVTEAIIFRGQCLVEAGSVVRAGQLLAGGLLEGEREGVRLTRASGQVLARTVRTYRVEVPFDYVQKGTGRLSLVEVSLQFFGHTQKIFKSTGKEISTCDIIKKTITPMAGKGREWPMGLTVTTYVSVTENPARRTAAEALTLAKAELRGELAADGTGRTLLSRTVETVLGEEGVVLLCTAVFEEDIAMVVEIALPPGEKEE